MELSKTFPPFFTTMMEVMLQGAARRAGGDLGGDARAGGRGPGRQHHGQETGRVPGPGHQLRPVQVTTITSDIRQAMYDKYEFKASCLQLKLGQIPV